MVLRDHFHRRSRPRWLEAQRHELLAVVLEPCLLSVSSCVLSQSGCLCRSPSVGHVVLCQGPFYRRRLRILTCPPTRTPYDPNEPATTCEHCEPSAVYGLGVTRRSSGACSAFTSFGWF